MRAEKRREIRQKERKTGQQDQDCAKQKMAKENSMCVDYLEQTARKEVQRGSVGKPFLESVLISDPMTVLVSTFRTTLTVDTHLKLTCRRSLSRSHYPSGAKETVIEP